MNAHSRANLSIFVKLAVSVVLAVYVASFQLTWILLDASRSGQGTAFLRFLVLWGGTTAVGLWQKSIVGRFVSYGNLIWISFFIKGLSPHLDLGFEPDLSATFDFGLVILALLLWVVAAFLTLIKYDQRRKARATFHKDNSMPEL